MSLLDQLSSLCIQSTYGNPMFSFTNNQQPIIKSIERQNRHLSTQNTIVKDESNVIVSNQHSSNSQQKVIKLFDDDQLQPNWRYFKTDKKPTQPRQQLYNTATKQQKTVSSQFKINNIVPQKDNQSRLMTLTKMSYLIKNKLRKINYEFFVKLEKYNKNLQKKQEEQQIEAKASKMLQMQCFITKLNEAIGVIKLKYFNKERDKKTDTNALSNAFGKIKKRGYASIKIDKLLKISKKLNQKKFFINLHQHNKKSIKLDLFYDLISTVIMKKLDANKMCFLMMIKQNLLLKKVEVVNNINQQLQNQLLDMWVQNHHKTSTKSSHVDSKQPMVINIIERPPIKLYPIKSTHIKTKCQQTLHFNHHHPHPQHIPLKQHNLKPQDQQTNLNDCVDNGHLLMAQIKANTSLFQLLANPSNLNNKSVKNSNSSVISEYLSSENFTTTQVSNDFTERKQWDSDNIRKTLYGHQKAKTTSIVSSMNPPRKSLLITKRKQSINQISTYANSPRNTEVQKFNTWSNKPKSTNTSVNKINQKQSQVKDKQIIKKMLQQLNQKFSCHDKVINITLIDKKSTSTQKKQSHANNTVVKKGQRKKVHSQLVSNSCAINCILQGEKRPQHTIKNQNISDNINRLQNKNSEQLKFQNQIVQNNFPIFFRPAQIKQSKRINNSSENTTICQERQQQRIKQSFSQISKKNPTLWYQQSDNNDISKALAKYKTKKKHMPESNLKIDLLPNKNNQYLGLQKSQHHRHNDNSFLTDNKLKNSIYFRDALQSVNKNCCYQQSLQSSKLSMIAPKQSLKQPSSFQVKHYNNSQQLSPSKDSVMAQYLPSQCQLKQPSSSSKDNYFSNYTHSSIYNKTHTSQSTYSYEPIEYNKQKSKPTSIEKKRSSLEKNKDQWDLMFEKQKKKFLKHQDAPKMVKRKSLLNEQVITELKNKIEQCFILGQRDQNMINADMTLKRVKKDQSLFLKEKVNNYEPMKTLSLQSSKKNSTNKLYATLSKLRRPEP